MVYENLIKSVLEAKRLFVAAQEPTEEALQTLQITEHEVIFWFKMLYPDRLHEVQEAIKYWKEKQILS